VLKMSLYFFLSKAWAIMLSQLRCYLLSECD